MVRAGSREIAFSQFLSHFVAQEMVVLVVTVVAVMITIIVIVIFIVAATVTS